MRNTIDYFKRRRHNMDSKHRIVSSIKTTRATYMLEYIPCGKKNCKRCPHGPYWYAYTRKKRKGKNKTVKRNPKSTRIYIGKNFYYLKDDTGELLKPE